MPGVSYVDNLVLFYAGNSSGVELALVLVRTKGDQAGDHKWFDALFVQVRAPPKRSLDQSRRPSGLLVRGTVLKREAQNACKNFRLGL